MRLELIDQMKLEIEHNLKLFLQEEGINLFIAANDNIPFKAGIPMLVLETIGDKPLTGYKLLSEIRVVLGLYGKIWQFDTLVDGIYLALHPHQFTRMELKFLLMSFHIESTTGPVRSRKQPSRRAIMRYIVEENT